MLNWRADGPGDDPRSCDSLTHTSESDAVLAKDKLIFWWRWGVMNLTSPLLTKRLSPFPAVHYYKLVFSWR